jgi:hypothetical protein
MALTNQGFKVRDAAVSVSKTLPASATVAYSDPIDLQNVAPGDFMAKCELRLTAPDLTVAGAVATLADSGTATYKVQHSLDNVTYADLYSSCIVQTGANATGAAAAYFNTRLPTGVYRYIRAACTTATSPGDMSAAKMILDLLF